MTRTVLDSLNAGLLGALAKNNQVVLMGEDILDPYGGAFKVSRGCSTSYPNQVITTPISEAGLAGVAAGMALRGLRPVLEIMFGDFMTLLADQLVNHIAKFRWMYNDSVRLPLVIRTPMGGRRGYGPTHSQTIEKLFLGIPGLTVVAPSNLVGSGVNNVEPGDLLQSMILEQESPVLFIENKMQYLLLLLPQSDIEEFDLTVDFDITDEKKRFPIYTLSVKGAPSATCVIGAYGYMGELARQAVLKLAYEHEIFAKLVIPTRLAPFAISPILNAVSETGNLVTVEEGTLSMGWGAEIIARTAEALPGKLRFAKRVAARETPIPAAATLERETLPQVDDIVDAIRKMSK
jgi:pyruvate/2-oxoglutarate/acetoin dehydrogenase E1 component